MRRRLTLCNTQTIICLLTCLRLLIWDLRLLRDRIKNRLYLWPYSYTKLAENLTESGRSSKNICVLFFESLSTTWRCNNLIFQSNFLEYLQVIFLWQFCSIIVFLEMIKTELLTSINPGGPRWSRGLHLIFLLDWGCSSNPNATMDFLWKELSVVWSGSGFCQQFVKEYSHSLCSF